MKRMAIILGLLFSLAVLCPLTYAASTEAENAASALWHLQLFQGVGKDKQGAIDFDLDRTPTRNEAITMLVRLLGREDEAKAGNWNMPFDDVADWAKPYVRYAYAYGLTTGISDTKFGGDNYITVAQYLTFVLRALGYSSSTDFNWETAWAFSNEIGLTNGQYSEKTQRMSRGDMALISYNALKCKLKDNNDTLIRKLYVYEDAIITKDHGIVQANLEAYTGTWTLNTPVNLRLEQDGEHTYLVWDPVVSKYGYPVQYDIHVSTIPNPQTYFSDYELFFSTSKNYVPIGNWVGYELNPNTQYYFRVQAHEHKNEIETHNSYPSNTVPFVTPLHIIDYSGVTTSYTPKESNSGLKSEASITQIFLNESKLNLILGSTFEIALIYEDRKATPDITLSSLDPEIVNLSTPTIINSNGRIAMTATAKAVAVGKTKIVATAKNGVSSSCTVTVGIGSFVEKAQMAVDSLKKSLSKPSSLLIHSVRVYWSNNISLVEIDYTTMNRSGGYDRKYWKYSESLGTELDYSIIDRFGYECFYIDINQLDW